MAQLDPNPQSFALFATSREPHRLRVNPTKEEDPSLAPKREWRNLTQTRNPSRSSRLRVNPTDFA
jgi:hypothetical protein